MSMYLLTKEQATIKFPTDGIINPDHVMYYKVNYDKKTLDAVKETLKLNHSQLSVQDRTGIISDLFSMAAAGKKNIAEALDAIQYIKVNYLSFKPF